MNEAIYGLLGVIIGAAIPVLQTQWVNKQTTKKNARYLAIRLVCILDNFMEGCIDVIKDDGLSNVQPDIDGCLVAQIPSPHISVYPNDVDWKSIDHNLMYKILSLPSEVEMAKRMVAEAFKISEPPNFEQFFNERRFWYSYLGLVALWLSQQLTKRYNIQSKNYNNWNPEEELKIEHEKAAQEREQQVQKAAQFVKRTLGDR